MRIGIVCEGQTDVFLIKYFLGRTLTLSGFDIEFVELQPQRDATQVSSGWSHVESWLKNVDPVLRSKRFFSGGLFDGDMDILRCDAILVQMDCDHVASDSFVNFMNQKYNTLQGDFSNYQFVESVLSMWCGTSSLTEADARRYILAPAELSTESWCVAAFRRWAFDPDTMSLQELTNAFMQALHMSESRPVADTYTSIDKSVLRREKFCKKHAQTCSPHVQVSSSFQRLHEKTIQAII